MLALNYFGSEIMNIQCKPFSELTALQVYQMLELRSEVFVVEQNCIYQDIDGKDNKPGVHHVLMTAHNRLLGYSRLLPPGLSYEAPSLGRIAIAATARRAGLGKQLLAQSVKHSQRLWPRLAITIGAQSYLVALYQQFGFEEVSAHYLEDGIEHVDMTASQPKYKEFL
jgi:ElaA protein